MEHLARGAKLLHSSGKYNNVYSGETLRGGGTGEESLDLLWRNPLVPRMSSTGRDKGVLSNRVWFLGFSRNLCPLPRPRGAFRGDRHTSRRWKTHSEGGAMLTHDFSDRTLPLVACLALQSFAILPVQSEDCTPVRASRLEVEFRNVGSWLVVDGDRQLLEFSTPANAVEAIELIQYYGMDRQCFVGRPNPSMQYFLVDGEAPVGPAPGEDCTAFNPDELRVGEFLGRSAVLEDDRPIVLTPSQSEAREVLATIREYGFDQACRVGDGMRYFRRDPAGMVVRISAKFILDADGNRATTGDLNTDEKLQAQVDIANAILCDTGRSVRIELSEVVDLPYVPRYFDSGCEDIDTIDYLAKLGKDLWKYRDDAVNLYVLGTGRCPGVCSFPDGPNDIIAIGQSSRETTLLHELGHFFGLCHTQGCRCGSCESGTGTCATVPGDDGIEDTLADLPCWNRDEIASWNFGDLYGNLSEARKKAVDDTFFNVLSYHAERSVLTQDQMDVFVQTARRERSDAIEFVEPEALSPCSAARGELFRRGNVDSSPNVDLSDVFEVLGFLFLDGGPLACPDAADVNDDGAINLSDPVSLLVYLFSGGVAPAAPGPRFCGSDVTPDSLPTCTRRDCD